MPTFSYAQAAKGFSSPAPTSTPAADQPTKSAQISDQPVANGIDSSKQETTPSADAPASAEAPADQDKSQPMEAKESLTVSTDTPASTKNTVSGATSPSYGTASSVTLPKEDDISFTPNGSSDSTWDKQSQISGPVEKDQSVDGGAEKPSEDGGERAPHTPKELKAAPIPTVNVWQKRMETQNAKAKTNVMPKPNGTVSSKAAAKSSSASPQTTSDSQFDSSKGVNKKKFGGAPDASETKERRKPADGGKFKDEGEYDCFQRAGSDLTIRIASRRNGFRSNRQIDTDPSSIGSAPPPAGDVASWPTPQLAQGEEKRKAQEKTDKGDKERSPVVRTHGKDKWMPVPYVPTAVFNTPLPPVARRGGGGRPTRGGGRDGATRGRGHGPTPSIGGEKSATGSANQASAPKQSTPSERGRHESSATQTDPLPTQARRHTSADAAMSPEQRKTSQFHQSERFGNDAKFSRGPEDHQNGAPIRPDNSHPSTSETLPRHRQDVRSFSRTQDPSTFPQKGADQSQRHVSLQGDYHGPTRYGTSRERRFDSGPRSADFFREPSGSFNPRDQNQTRERGDSRPERGRGGYRGRGGHSTYAGSQNSQYHIYQQGNQSYQPPKPYHRSHQHGHQNGTQPQNPNSRLNLRSPSLPSSAMYNSYPVPTDFNAMYGYPQMQPGPMSAVPYQPYLEPFSLISMISMQL